jgi:hypothetical protein
MKSSSSSHNQNNVIDMFSGEPYSTLNDQRFIRLSPELDGLEILYSNESSPDKLFSLKILCWGLRANGEVVALVPWLSGIVAAPQIQDPLNGEWQGYFDPGIEEIFNEAPIHKIVELETAAEYYDSDFDQASDIVQEIPDTIGTHAVLSANGFHNITLTEVVSWRLCYDGSINGMIADTAKIECTPVLPGDACLYSAKDREDFRYFFQHQIANQLKSNDPEALAAIATLVE